MTNIYKNSGFRVSEDILFSETGTNMIFGPKNEKGVRNGGFQAIFNSIYKEGFFDCHNFSLEKYSMTPEGIDRMKRLVFKKVAKEPFSKEEMTDYRRWLYEYRVELKEILMSSEFIELKRKNESKARQSKVKSVDETQQSEYVDEIQAKRKNCTIG